MVRQHWAALRALLVFTVLLGVGYPLLIWLVAGFPGCMTRRKVPLSKPAVSR
ncbi:potassium-transporting ATPase subunit C domain protein [Mycobacterium kansasii]|uniref:Potassium-transporting ATPase subunit C domain protein n=1 Tax=Mycobacterium kansasii TaxID=1768 RepID=A0A1V3XH16_MYCKA|nr:potassium-transporting ATPase subunit C domain protein [Mycobacterium kansasii]